MVQRVPSYLRDSADLISKLQAISLPPNAILAIVDVSALYLSIPHQEGIQACVQVLDLGSPPPFPSTVTREILSTILTQNIFEFDGHMFRQVRGTAMGTKMAPSLYGPSRGDDAGRRSSETALAAMFFSFGWKHWNLLRSS